MLNLADYVNVHCPTVQSVKDLINVSSGRTTPVPVIELLDNHNQPRFVLPDGSNDLTAAGLILTNGWSKNDTADIMSTIDVRARGDIGDFVRVMKDRFFVKVKYMSPLGVELNRFPIGIYMFNVADVDYWDRDKFYTAKLSDEGQVLTEEKFLQDFVAPTGLKISTILSAMLRMDYRTPQDGGRQPSGIAWSGTPGATAAQNTAPHTAAGVLSTTVATLNVVTGYLETASGPAGVIQFNPYQKAIPVDPTSFIPLEPLSGNPMRLVPQSPAYFNDVSLGLYFKPSSGEYVLPFTASPGSAVDPLKPGKNPYPSGIQVKQVATPTTSVGSIQGPLSTWPYDYDNSGPYYTSNTTTTVTTTAPSPGPSGTTIGTSLVLASVYQLGLTTLIPSGAWSGSQTASTANPAYPGTNVVKPVAAYGAAIQGPDIGSWVIPGGVWSITVPIFGLAGLNGAINGEVLLYRGSATPTGTATNRIADLVSTGTPTFDSSGALTLTFSGAVTGFTAAAGEHLWAMLKLNTSDITIDIGNGNASAAINRGPIDVNFTAATALPSGVTYTTPGTPGAPVAPISSGSVAPWPDTNNPGMAPSSCGQEGPNIPDDRIDIPDFPDVLLDTQPGTRNVTFMALMQSMAAMMSCYKLSPNMLGIWGLKRQPYTVDATVPETVWTFSNENPLTDGKIFAPLNRRSFDVTTLLNVSLFVSEKNSKVHPIWAKLTNDLPNSIVSRAVIERTIHGVLQDDSVSDQDTANLLANNQLQGGSTGIDSVNFSTHCMPQLERGDPIDVIWINHRTGVTEIDSRGNPYFITNIDTVMLNTGVDSVSKITAQRMELL